MESSEDALTPIAVIAERVRALRRRHGWSQEQLAEELSRVGVPWQRMVVTKLEAGRREGVSVSELLALAYVLNVAPVHLMVPVTDDGRMYAITPDEATPATEAREWIRGRVPLYGQDPRVYFSEVPATEWEPPKMSEREVQEESRVAPRRPRGSDDGSR